jgi:hypothetical protein
MIAVARIDLPDFGMEAVRPELSVRTYLDRLTQARKGMARQGLDVLAVYGDREHFANLAYLTGMDPRFEEALLLLDRGDRGLMIVGNECMGYLPDERLGLDGALFQEFSLMGQPRGDSRPLREIFSAFGIGRTARVGGVGWKCYDSRLSADARYASDLPSYIVDLLRETTGGPENVTNATGLFTDPSDGLRVVNMEVEQIALLEYASLLTSTSVLTLLRNLREGSPEDELARWLDSRGLPLSCHPMIRFGENARRGLASPSQNRAKRGDAYTVGFGIVGSLTSRAGCVARGPQDLPAATRDFYAKFAANYFGVVAAWYRQLRVGASAGDVVAAVEAKRDDSLYRFAVNPGHYIHLDEWLHSPFAPGSRIALRSGMAIQMDIIPVSKGPFCCVNAEDGVVLADDSLRSALAAGVPACWQRIQARRAFMADAIGIRLHESVLPLSNIPAWLPPYALAMENAFVAK